MDDLKIGEGLARRMEKEEQVQIEQALQEDKTPEGGRNILITIAVLVGIFALSLGGFKTYDHFTGAPVVNVDDLHQQNLDDQLKSEEGYTYNGYSFVKVDGLWWTEIKLGNVLYKVPLHFSPKEVANISVKGKLDSSFDQGDEIYIAIDPEFTNQYYSLALNELNFNVVKGIGRKPVGVCTKDNPICDNRTTLNCENNKGKPVIELKWSNQTKVNLKGTCILVEGQGYDLVRAADRLIWQWYGVMN